VAASLVVFEDWRIWALTTGTYAAVGLVTGRMGLVETADAAYR